MFTCRFCEFQTQSLDKKVKHWRTTHRNITTGFDCGYNKCKRVCPSETCLRNHLFRVHFYRARKEPVLTSALVPSNLKCGVQICQKICDSYSALKKHLDEHLIENIDVPCPFDSCSKVYSNLNSFRSHISKFHRGVSPVQVPVCDDPVPVDGVGGNNGDINSIADASAQGQDPVQAPCFVFENDFDVEGEPDLDMNDENTLKMTVALFFLKLEGIHNVPTSTVQKIFEELKEIDALSREHLNRKLNGVVAEQLGDHGAASKIADLVSSDPSFAVHHKDLSTIHLRKKYFRDNLPFNQPIQMHFRNPDGTETGEVFYYVPILETLKKMFQDTSVKEQYLASRPSKPGILQDFYDGNNYQSNVFFHCNPDGLEIILFEDAFEIANPLGSAKGKHKLQAVYLTLGNTSPEWRFRRENIQLVALCRDKDYEHSQFYGQLVRDLKTLETEGIEIYPGKVAKGVLVHKPGDNLGTHRFAGLQENFSRAEFFCRFCLIPRASFAPEFPFFPRRTVSSHNEAIEALNADENLKSYQGVKMDSLFNELHGFHTSKGLPPCLAHDLFEGVVAYDLAVYIRSLVEGPRPWFTIKELNARIDAFGYSVEDRQDKPKSFKPKFEKVPGSACEVWALIRLFPLIIHDKIMDVNDDAWKLILSLREIVLLVSAPTVKASNLSYVEDVILDYLDLRSESYPEVSLRPKHHYLQHYPELTLEFGPLIKAWTLRFESKHKDLKRKALAGGNFINIMKTLTEKHEYMQCYLRAGASYKPAVTISKEIPFYPDLFHEDIQTAATIITAVPVMQCLHVSFRGTNFRVGHAVVLDQGQSVNDLTFGQIKMILIDKDECVHFVVEVKVSQYRPHLQIFVFQGTSAWKCVRATDLLDYLPLYPYEYKSARCVTLKHGVMLWG